MNPLPADLLSILTNTESLFCGACECAEDAKSREPTNVLKNAGSSMDRGRISALFLEHVLTGATQLVGAGRSRKTPDIEGKREFLSLTRTMLNLGSITLLVRDGPCLS